MLENIRTTPGLRHLAVACLDELKAREQPRRARLAEQLAGVDIP